MHSPEYEQCAQDFLELEDSEGRLRILRAAYPLFVERGYDGVSMQGIADAVPLNKATL
jgi:AcrR family transcriptional regulator